MTVHLMKHYNPPCGWTYGTGTVSCLTDYAKGFPTSHIYLPMGDDFYYQTASSIYSQVDNFISSVNSNS